MSLNSQHIINRIFCVFQGFWGVLLLGVRCTLKANVEETREISGLRQNLTYMLKSSPWLYSPFDLTATAGVCFVCVRMSRRLELISSYNNQRNNLFFFTSCCYYVIFRRHYSLYWGEGLLCLASVRLILLLSGDERANSLSLWNSKTKQICPPYRTENLKNGPLFF